ncbi:uncharacterized protein LOC113515925 [Galleria mellonella]|uniref:Uncharacterized protein LOC113515925 n=1 Tax=Galleria mellonella TaxID=7137 RepID=A0A6J1WMI9_GALME|nr:uncharacterized protein LOC113515925 [Galleria mellonella]
MQPCINLITLILLFIVKHTLVGFSQSFLYEAMHNFGLGKRLPDYQRIFNEAKYPKPLPSTKATPYMRSPFENIYQGSRRRNDRRVYRRSFDYEAQSTGHQVLFEGTFDCKISHIAAETKGGIPILFRGGAGYNYFKVIVKAPAGHQLTGTVRVYCLDSTDDYRKESLRSRYNNYTK